MRSKKLLEMSGGCLCGAKRFRAAVSGGDAYLCHCRMCQRASGNVSLAFVNLAKSTVSWEDGKEADYFASSAIARRGFCATCGTSLSFEYPDSDRMDLTIAAFDDPRIFRPQHHFGVEAMHRAWLDTRGLPEYRSDEHIPLVERWIKTVGELPD